MSLQIAFVATAPSSSFGTSTAKSISRRWPMSTIRHREPRRLGPLRNFGQGLVQILLDVVTERFERRDVHDLRAVFEAAGECLLEQGIKTGEEGGERLAGAGGRGDQDVVARLDRWPAAGLHVGGRAEARAGPLRDG